jgi:adenylyl-sulfate kinase
VPVLVMRPCTLKLQCFKIVCREEKERRLGQRGCVLWFTGLSGSGKSTVAATVEHALAQAGHATALLDGDNVRHGLNCNLGFSAGDRSENIRRIGEVSRLLVQTGLITLAAFISPYRADRQRVRERLPPGDFIEVCGAVPAPCLRAWHGMHLRRHFTRVRVRPTRQVTSHDRVHVILYRCTCGCPFTYASSAMRRDSIRKHVPANVQGSQVQILDRLAMSVS